MYYVLAANVSPRMGDDGFYHLIVNGTGVSHVFRAESTFEHLLAALQDGVTAEDCAQILGVDLEKAISGLEGLRADGLVWIVSKDIHEEYIQEREGAYGRNISALSVYLGGWEEALKAYQAIRASRVMIIGLGGLGSPVASGLARVGIGELVLCDPDIVEESNLVRQTLFKIEHIGSSKVDAAAAELAKISKNILVYPVSVFFDELIASKLLAEYKPDIVVCCADRPSVQEISQMVNKICYEHNVQYMTGGGYTGHAGRVGMAVIPYETSCYNCQVSSYVREEHVALEKLRSLRDIPEGTLLPVSSILADLYIAELISLITSGPSSGLRGTKGEISLWPFRVIFEDVPVDPDCEFHTTKE